MAIFDEAMRKAAKVANAAVTSAMTSYRRGRVVDEDDINPYVIGRLDAEFDNAQIAGLHWSASILRHRRGVAAQEGRAGADMLIHVKLDTKKQKYSKGILIQAKRVLPGRSVSENALTELRGQCDRMLAVTPASYVMVYAPTGVRTDSALRMSGNTSRRLHDVCSWTSYRLFRELFRCPIGDRAITSARFEDLDVPDGIELTAEGKLED